MGTVGSSPVKVKRALKSRGVTYGDVARLAGVSWFMVWSVVNRRKTSAPVRAAIRKLLGEESAA